MRYRWLPLPAIRSRMSAALRSRLAREYLPAARCDDDLFLVEFPKSGMTWLTFLIANVNAQLSGDRRAVTFFNINDFVPDVWTNRYATMPRTAVPGYRCFKSHAPYLRQYRKVIYLVRDPRDVLVSFWVFLRGLGWWRGTLEELVADRQHGIEGWTRHVSGWLSGIDAAASFSLIRYEDLLANTTGELKRLYGLLGLPVSEEVLAAAIERSSIERMRALDSQFAAGHPARRRCEFVRRHPAGGGRIALPAPVRDLIEQEAASLMERLGYSHPGADEALARLPADA